MTQQTPPSCPAITTAGKPCRARPTHSGWCWHHAPELAESRDAARAKGGRNSATAMRTWRGLPTPVLDTLDVLRQALTDTRDGKMAPSTANAVANVGRAILSAWDLAHVEARMDALEDHMAGVTVTRDRLLRAVE